MTSQRVPYVAWPAIRTLAREILGERRPDETIFSFSMREARALDEARLSLVTKARTDAAEAA
jgi:hypothetical protein